MCWLTNGKCRNLNTRSLPNSSSALPLLVIHITLRLSDMLMVTIFVYVNTPYTDFLSNGLCVVLDIFK